MSTKEEAEIIRRHLKSLCKTLSVRLGKGTAYGWIRIRGSGPCGDFTDTENKILTEIGLTTGMNCVNIAPGDRHYWLSHLQNLLKSRS